MTSAVRTIDVPQMASLINLLHQYRTAQRGQVILHLAGGTANVMLIAVRDSVTHAPTGRTELRVHLDTRNPAPPRVTEV